MILVLKHEGAEQKPICATCTIIIPVSMNQWCAQSFPGCPETPFFRKPLIPRTETPYTQLLSCIQRLKMPRGYGRN